MKYNRYKSNIINIDREVDIEEYDYLLPDERIAKYPLAKRDSSKLLVYRNGDITSSRFHSLPEYIPSGSLMIFNDSKVIQARMHFQKQTGAVIEIFCLEPHEPHDYALIFQQTRKCSWACLIGNLKKWKEGDLIKTVNINGIDTTIFARLKQSHQESHIVEFEWDNDTITFADILDVGGELPIPPYLNRDTEEQDKETYQTVYSKVKGSVAAPTAGLHFTEKVLHDLQEKGVELNQVTLHVGAGTFRPVKTTVSDHIMHSEFFSVRRNLIEHLLSAKGLIIAVGTTSIRTLESLYYIGEILEKNSNSPSLKVTQKQAYAADSNQISVQKALANIIAYLDKHSLNNLIAETQIMIKPGYNCRIVDALVTNFHQPKSTLMLLISAFIGDNNTNHPDFDKWKSIYNYALNNDFRFLSYGDSSLLLND